MAADQSHCTSKWLGIVQQYECPELCSSGIVTGIRFKKKWRNLINLHNTSQNISTVWTPRNRRYSADTVDQTNCLQSVQLNADQQAAGVPARNWCPRFPLWQASAESQS